MAEKLTLKSGRNAYRESWQTLLLSSHKTSTSGSNNYCEESLGSNRKETNLAAASKESHQFSSPPCRKVHRCKLPKLWSQCASLHQSISIWLMGPSYRADCFLYYKKYSAALEKAQMEETDLPEEKIKSSRTALLS